MSMPRSHFNDARASVADLTRDCTRASSLPCSAATPAFAQLAQSTSNFQLALDALFPVLDSQAQRESVLVEMFVKERENALTGACNGGIAANEPLVWVLWKILKGEGDDIGPYSPSALARSVLPLDFRATQLTLHDTLCRTPSDLDDVMDVLAPSHTPEFACMAPPEDDKRQAALAHSTRLLLAARQRVLSLAEQRQLIPFLSSLAASALAPADIAPLVAHNPALAASFCSTFLLRAVSAPTAHLSALAYLPPTLQTFDVLGRLLRNPDPGVSALVGSEVLGPFVDGAVEWLGRAETEELEGSVIDDRFAKGVMHLCRLYTSLIKFGLVDPARDVDSAPDVAFQLATCALCGGQCALQGACGCAWGDVACARVQLINRALEISASLFVG
ncbi:hypothetical protein FB451DRAFT_777157 [Mycena latifolia]|nr:hypothetical protein FB451DRAFT_777157 [Mycena latifolia]